MNATYIHVFARSEVTLSPYVQKKVRERIKQEFGDHNLDENVNMTVACVKKHQYITVFREDEQRMGKNIEESIMRALLKGIYT